MQALFLKKVNFFWRSFAFSNAEFANSASLIASRKLPAGIEPATPSLRVKCTTDCAKEA